MKKEDALRQLAKEKDYEEKLSQYLIYFIQDSLSSIQGLSNEELGEIKNKLNTIGEESLKHKNMLDKLINTILENGKANY